MTTEISALEQMINKDIQEVINMADETKVLEADPTRKGQDLLKGDESNSKDTPKNYTEKEHLKGIEDAIAQYGDRVKREKIDPITQERDTFKAKADQATKEAKEATETLKETREHIKNLESDIETLEENDTDPNKVLRLRRELRDAKINVSQEVKTERDAIKVREDTLAELQKTTEAERLEWAETVSDAQAFKLDGELAKVVDEYEGDVTANFTKLKTACDRAGVKTKEGAEAIAETFLTKKGEEPNLLEDSGVSSGGREDLNNLSPRELLRTAYKPKKR